MVPSPADMNDRVEKIEGDLYRIHPENPGAILRLDRIERLLEVMLKIGGVVAGLGLLWKALDVVGEIIGKKIGP